MNAPSSLTVTPAIPGAIKQALDQTGWIAGDVIAAGQLRQGRPPSTFGLLSGTALVELARPRRSRSLPRHFVLAVTADTVVAFKASSLVMGPEAGPELIRIKPGACGSWPRASVRLLDLPEGALSKGATLELEGTERVPVSRPNLDGDPNTDELLELLGGLSIGSPPPAARQQRVDVLAGDPEELAADARRGRPDVELEGWARRRSLSFRGGAAQGGHLSVTCPWSKDLLFNVVRGRWPGGAEGVVCHGVRLFDVDSAGFFHGGKVIGPGEGVGAFLLDAIVPIPLGGGRSFFKVPYTCAGARVPHLATLTGLHVARVAERRIGADPLLGSWHERPLERVGRQGDWVARVRKHSDERTVDALLDGPIRELLSVQQGLGFEIRIEYGQAIVSRQDFLKRDEDLDELVATAEALAGAVREICVPPGSPRPLATRIAPPEWLAPVRRRPREKHTLWPPGARLEKLVEIADARAMAVEDPRAFHAAFPELNIPGEAFGVLHGRLPGTELTGRLLCCAERPMALPDDVRKLLHDPGGPVGCDVAVVAVDADAAPTVPEGEIDGGLRFAIADGVLTAWRVRRSWQADGAALDQLAADVASVAENRRRNGGPQPGGAERAARCSAA
jgi:hypothetical protein